MKEKANYLPVFGTVLLVCAGLISPSNGVDDGMHKSPADMITNMVLVISAGVLVVSVWKMAAHFGLTSSIRSKKNHPSRN
jgi:hypothetical protein